MLAKSFLNILACPCCKGNLACHGDAGLACVDCGRNFIVANGIPVLSDRPISLPPMKKNDRNEDMFSSSTEYHLKELRIAQDPMNPKNIMPSFRSDQAAILDIGCGIGQTYVASGLHEDPSRLLIGLDIDYVPLNYGRNHYSSIHFINCHGDTLPVKTGSMDMVISRVSLLYTNIPQAFAEIRRVLKPGGEIWITLNPASKQARLLLRAFQLKSPKGVLTRSWVMLNGCLLHLFGKVLPFPLKGGYESFQSKGAMRRLLEKQGFGQVELEQGSEHFLITARKCS